MSRQDAVPVVQELLELVSFERDGLYVLEVVDGVLGLVELVVFVDHIKQLASLQSPSILGHSLLFNSDMSLRALLAGPT